MEDFFWLLFRDERWEEILLYYSPSFGDLVGKNAREIGEYFHTTPLKGMLEILRLEGEQMFSVLMMGKIKRGDHLERIMSEENTGIVSDSISLAKDGPLSGVIWSPGSYGWIPHFLNTYAGEGKLLSMEEGIRRLTSLPAQRIGLTDRGLLRENHAADIVVFDKKGLEETATLAHPAEYARGVEHVLCNGEMVLEHGAYTGARPGRVVRKRG
jgi:N-acyl-D-amino-acid deacylase